MMTVVRDFSTVLLEFVKFTSLFEKKKEVEPKQKAFFPVHTASSKIVITQNE